MLKPSNVLEVRCLMKEEELLETRNCCSDVGLEDLEEMSGQESRPSLGELVQRFGLEVPYTRHRHMEVTYTRHMDLEVPYTRHKDLPPPTSERAGGQVEDRSRLAPTSVSPALQRLSSLSCRLSAKLEELWRAVETLPPVAILRAALDSVTFQQDLGGLGPPALCPVREQEHLPLEHWARLEEVFLLHDRSGRGFLTKDDLLGCLRTLGHNPTERELWSLMAQVDT